MRRMVSAGGACAKLAWRSSYPAIQLSSVPDVRGRTRASGVRLGLGVGDQGSQLPEQGAAGELVGGVAFGGEGLSDVRNGVAASGTGQFEGAFELCL